jgi:hypothetical protein
MLWLGMTQQQVVYEVEEFFQPHAMGWPDPPRQSHGLFNSREGAQRRIDSLRGTGSGRMFDIKERRIE